MNIVLIGYRGSGKTHIGKRLASKLWKEFVDTDALIVERAAETIRDIFEQEGEAGFRDREAAVIREVAARDNLIIAAGGGAVLRPENVAALKKNGKLVWLQASPEVLLARIQADAGTSDMRPNLTPAGAGGGGGGIEEVKQGLAERSPLYEVAADVRLEVTYLDIDAAAIRLTTMI